MPAHRERVIGNNLFVSLSRHPFLWSEAELERMAAETLAWQPVFLDLDPVYGVVFAQFCERRGIKLPSVRFILCSYEFVSVAHRRILQRVFGAPIFNLYGSTETGHLLMENERGEMIPSAQTAFLEVIQPDAHGIGELVGTTLTNEYMPLIRYRIGDLVETHALTEQTTYTLHGRKKDAFIRSDGARITTLQIDRLFSGLEGITHYQLLELKGNDWQLRFVPEGGGPDGAALAGLQKRLAEMLQITGKLEGQPADLLMPEGSGKFRLGYPLRQAAE
jgi:phenylacetate-CoA ligase